MRKLIILSYGEEKNNNSLAAFSKAKGGEGTKYEDVNTFLLSSSLAPNSLSLPPQLS
jgi:hypothetical protein